MNMPFGTEVDLGTGQIVLDVVSADRERGTAAPHSFRQCLLWPRSPISATAELVFKTRRKLQDIVETQCNKYLSQSYIAKIEFLMLMFLLVHFCHPLLPISTVIAVTCLVLYSVLRQQRSRIHSLSPFVHPRPRITS